MSNSGEPGLAEPGLSRCGMSASSAEHDDAFAAELDENRRRVQLHCYRMVGSLEESEDLAQETIVRAWRSRSGFHGDSALHTWLYRIATNACLDFLAKRRRRSLPSRYDVALEPGADPPAPGELVWLDPYPERLLEQIAAEDADPEAAVTAKETVEIAFLQAIQNLPANRRAVLILRDLLDWSAKDTAETLSLSVPAVNTALRRGREAMKEHLPRRREEWSPTRRPSESERDLLRRYVEAHERGDVDALAELLREDARMSVPPLPRPREGRDAILGLVRRSASPGRFRYVTTSANGQLAAASYVLRDGAFTPLAIDVLRIENGEITELAVFLRPELFPSFGLPVAL